MIWWPVRRCAEALITLFVLVSLAFALAHAVPGGPAYAILGLKAHPISVTAVDLQLGTDVPVWRQYAIWWSHVVQGQLGTSYRLNRDVRAVIADYLGNTLALDAAGLALAAAAGFFTGLVHGMRPDTAIGRAIDALELSIYAMPGFFIATLMLMLFATTLHWLPAGGVVNLRVAHPGMLDRLRHIVLPACSLALLGLPGFSRVLAQSVQSEFARDYVRTARARGLGELPILWRHVLPNALRPFVTLLGLSLPGVFAAGVVVESVFAYPGLGWLLWRSAVSHDYPVLIGIVLLVGAATIAGNFLADIVNSRLDPTTKYV